jgi:hypothetical protein
VTNEELEMDVRAALERIERLTKIVETVVERMSDMTSWAEVVQGTLLKHGMVVLGGDDSTVQKSACAKEKSVDESRTL